MAFLGKLDQTVLAIVGSAVSEKMIAYPPRRNYCHLTMAMFIITLANPFHWWYWLD
jgi:hypothetical protein